MKWGIIGAGNIAHRFAKSMKHNPEDTILKVYGRNLEKIQAFAKEYAIPMVSTDPNDLYTDSAIDALYIALPHGMHKEATIEALRHKKAVLCEKPLSISAGDVKKIMEVAEREGVLCMEAMKTRFVPGYRAMKEDLAKIGPIVSIETVWDHEMGDHYPTYYIDPIQGGSLLDCGIYGLGLIQDLLKEDVLEIETEQKIVDGVDFYTRALLKFAQAEASVESACDRTKPVFARIIGEKGTIHLPNFHRVESYTIETEAGLEEKNIPYEVDDFYSEIAHFDELMKDKKIESPIMPLQDSLACATLLDAIKNSAK